MILKYSATTCWLSGGISSKPSTSRSAFPLLNVCWKKFGKRPRSNMGACSDAASIRGVSTFFGSAFGSFKSATWTRNGTAFFNPSRVSLRFAAREARCARDTVFPTPGWPTMTMLELPDNACARVNVGAWYAAAISGQDGR